jgi:hypothetical protein
VSRPSVTDPIVKPERVWADDELPEPTEHTNGVASVVATTDDAAGAPWTPLVSEVPGEWYSEQPPKREWLLRDTRQKARGVLPLGKVGQLIAEGGAGKTMVLCQLAVSVATGEPFLGVFSVPTPGRVLLVLGEEDAAEARRRLHRAARASRGRQPDPRAIVVLPLAGVHAPMLSLDESGNLVETEFLRWLRDYSKAGDFRLVAIDPLSRFAGPNAETDNAAATRFIQSLESLAGPATSIINSHHINKVSRGKDGHLDATSGRGSSAFVDGARWQCALSVERLEHDGAEKQARLGEVVTLAVTKSNYAARPEPLLLRRDLDNGGALLPVAADDVEAVESARASATLRTPARAARDAEGLSKSAAEDEAVLQAVTAEPGLSWRRLAVRVAALANCGDHRARKAIERMANRLEVRHGKRSATMYYLRGEAPADSSAECVDSPQTPL